MKELFVGAAIGMAAGIMLGMNPKVRQAIEQAKTKLSSQCSKGGQNKGCTEQGGAHSANGCGCATCDDEQVGGACECGDDCGCRGVCECDSDTCL